MAIPRKGLQNIRTIPGMVNQAFSATYKAYLQLFCLEMEKFRRGKEKESAMRRVKTIDARFEEIETSKASILKALNLGNSGAVSAARDTESKSAHSRSTEGFKIKY
jgi:hypothetical protein